MSPRDKRHQLSADQSIKIMTTVNLTNLTKTYPDSGFSVEDFNLEIPSGKITALLGPSGSGKSTLLKLIAGLLTPDNGDLTFDDVSVVGIPAEQRGAVMAFQNNLVFPWLSVGENVAFGLKMRGISKAKRQQQAKEMLNLVQLAGFENRKPSELSGGQQQRISLARALVTQPKVLLLDEPLSNLDAHLREEMRALIQSLQQQFEITTVVVTHDQEEAVILADQIALLFDGKLHQYGEPSDFYQRPTSRRVAEFFGGVNFIDGYATSNKFITDVGIFTTAISDASANTLSIRPEHLQVINTQAENTLGVTLLEQSFMGTYYRYTWQTIQNPELVVISTSTTDLHISIGESTQLLLPTEHLMLLE